MQVPTPITRKRIISIFIALVVGFACIAGRVVYVNTAMSDKLLAYRYRQSKRLINLHARRGGIYDVDGNVLAMDVPCQSVYVVPDAIEKKAAAASALAKALHMPRKKVLEIIGKDKSFVWLKRRADEGEINAVKRLNIKGAGFLDETRRVYPNKTLASNIIGFYGDDRGIEGIEATLEAWLRGESGFIELEKDAIGRNVPNSVRQRIDPVNGNDVYLTINNVLQYTAEHELRATVEKHKAASGTVVVIEPRTGRIVAMASFPDFDPNNFADFPKMSYRNHAVSFVYEPGSIMKPLIAAAALEEGIMGPHSPTLFCGSSYRIDGYNISEAHGDGYGQLDLTGIIRKSSNIGMAQIGLKMGGEKLKHYVSVFGFGQKIKIGLYGSEYGLLPADVNWPRQSTQATVSYGQGVSVTPLQMAMAYAAIANNGILMHPTLLDRIVSPEGKTLRQFRPREKRRVMSEKTALEMRDMLQVAVDDGTGKSARVPNYTVGGKTGTALVAVNGSYGAKKYSASFVGMAPIDNPRFVVLVTIYDPTQAYYGGVVAAPLFQKVMQQALMLYKVPPSYIDAPEKPKPGEI